MTVEEVKVKFTAQVDDFKKNINTMKSTLNGVTDSLESVTGDIKRATDSNDKNIQKIGKSLEQEVKKFNSASQASKRYSQTVNELGQKLAMATTKSDKLESSISQQESKVNTMRSAYDAMSDTLSNLNIPDSIEAESERLTATLEQNKTKAYELEQAMEQLQNSQYDVGEVGGEFMNLEQMETALKKVDSESEQAYNRLSKLKSGVEGVSAEFLAMGNATGLKKMETQITSAEAKLLTMRGSYQTTAIQINNLNARQTQASAKMEQAKTQVTSTTSRIQQLRASLGSLSATTRGEFMANLSAKIHNVGNAMSTLIHKFQTGASAVASFMGTAGAVGKQLISLAGRFTILGRAVTGAGNLVRSFGSKFRMTMMMIKSIVLSMLLMQLFSNIGETFQSFAKQSSSMNSSLSSLVSSFKYLRNAIVSAFSPILSIVTPIITSLINKVADAVNALGEFFAMLAGQSTYKKAVYVQEDYSDSLDDTADSTNDATEASEAYKKSVMGFDEINKLDDSSSSDSSGNSGSGSGSDSSGGYWTTENVDVSSSIVDDIKNGDWYAVGEAISKKLNDAMASINWDSIQAKANTIAKNIADFLNGAVAGLDWSLVGKTLGEGINTAMGFIDTFLTNFDFEKFGTSVATAINSAFSTTDWSLVGKTLGDQIEAIIDTAFGVIETLDWGGIGEDLATATDSCFGAVDFSKAGKTVGDAVKGVLNTVGTYFEKVDWKSIGNDLVDTITGVDWIGIITKALKAVFAVAGAFVDLVNGIITGIINAVKDTDWTQVAKDMWNMIVTAWNGLKDVTVKVGVLLADTAQSLWDLLLAGWNALANVIFNVELAIVTKAIDLWNDVKAKWETVKTDGLEVVASLKAKAETTKEQVLAKFQTVTADWKDKTNDLKMKVATEVETVKTWFQNRSAQWKDITSDLKMKVNTEVSTVKTWFKNRSEEWKDKAVSFTINCKNKADEIKKEFKSAINTIISWINKYIVDSLNKISIKVPQIKVAGKTLFAGKTFGFNVKHIASFKTGGFPEGENGLFYANSQEMVGKFTNGKTAVANNYQIVEGIEAGVYRAMASANAQNSGENGSQIKVYVGGTELTDYVVKDVNNRTKATGKCPILT